MRHLLLLFPPSVHSSLLSALSTLLNSSSSVNTQINIVYSHPLSSFTYISCVVSKREKCRGDFILLLYTLFFFFLINERWGFLAVVLLLGGNMFFYNYLFLKLVSSSSPSIEFLFSFCGRGVCQIES